MPECLYQNNTDKMIVLKCIGDNKFYREKVVMPTESFWFEAPVGARLEIWQMSLQGQMLHLRADVSDYAITSEEPSQTTSVAAKNSTAVFNRSRSQRQAS